jgi:hypothetical protein
MGWLADARRARRVIPILASVCLATGTGLFTVIPPVAAAGSTVTFSAQPGVATLVDHYNGLA